MQNKVLFIGELADRIGINPKTIRYYEEINLLSKPKRGSNNYRVYSQDTVTILRFIKKAQTLGFTLKEIREILTSCNNGNPCRLIGELLKEKVISISKKLEELKKLQISVKKLESEWSEMEISEYCVSGMICPKIEKYFLEQ